MITVGGIVGSKNLLAKLYRPTTWPHRVLVKQVGLLVLEDEVSLVFVHVGSTRSSNRVLHQPVLSLGVVPHNEGATLVIRLGEQFVMPFVRSVSAARLWRRFLRGRHPVVV